MFVMSSADSDFGAYERLQRRRQLEMKRGVKHLRTTHRDERGWRVHPGQQYRLYRLPHVFTLCPNTNNNTRWTEKSST